MESLLLLLVCALLGIVAARLVSGAREFVIPLNWWVLNIALPALVLELIPKLTLGWDLWFLPVSQWLVFLGSWAFFALMGKVLHWTPQRIGGLTLIAGLGNSMFIAYPVIEAALGREAMPYAVIADQAGAFMALTVGGAVITAVYSRTSVAASTQLTRVIVHRLVRFPPAYALVLGLAVGRFGGWPVPVDNLLLRIGATLTPLALFSAGLQFRLSLKGDQSGAVALGVAWKLLLAPLIIALLGWTAGSGGFTYTVGVLQAAMPPMISAAILAAQHDLEPDIVSAVLALGLLLSAITLPVAVFLL